MGVKEIKAPITKPIRYKAETKILRASSNTLYVVEQNGVFIEYINLEPKGLQHSCIFSPCLSQKENLRPKVRFLFRLPSKSVVDTAWMSDSD